MGDSPCLVPETFSRMFINSLVAVTSPMFLNDLSHLIWLHEVASLMNVGQVLYYSDSDDLLSSMGRCYRLLKISQD